MEKLLIYIEMIEDVRQQTKVLHKLLDIVVIVLFAKLANADDWEEKEVLHKYEYKRIFSENNEFIIKKFLWFLFF